MQTSIKHKCRGWNRSMPLPREEQAKQYRRILSGLGYESQKPLETTDGYVVKFRKKKN
ncbi:hypothetical protein [Tumebacillus flagellatus]|uniref:hypothetical protein n=1 Tax=Tumebacillus flagellatus TaxID=1157490 RepID=UPI0013776088|nr:hypothetical protein [Tumebacillus flagellatus]